MIVRDVESCRKDQMELQDQTSSLIHAGNTSSPRPNESGPALEGLFPFSFLPVLTVGGGRECI